MGRVVQKCWSDQLNITGFVEDVEQDDVGERLNVLQPVGVRGKDFDCPNAVRFNAALNRATVLRRVGRVDRANLFDMVSHYLPSNNKFTGGGMAPSPSSATLS